MKVVFVTRGWPTKDNPMSGNYEAVQARALAKRGINVSVIYLQKKSLPHVFKRWKIKRIEDDGITVLSSAVVVSELPGIEITKNLYWDLKNCQRRFLKVYEYYRAIKGDADVIHAHLIVHAANCKMVLDKYHIPFVITEHWSKMNFASLSKSIIRISDGYRWADKVICVSKALADSLKAKLGVESEVIHNMVSDNFFQQSDSQPATKDNRIVKFISVGSLIGGKGYDLIIKALRDCKHLNDCQVSIIGGGPEEADLKAMIEEYHLQDKVTLLGKKTSEEVSALMTSSDCFILTSRRETFGIVYIEAMAKGKPVIATICGGPESFVNESNGILIPTEDVEATTKAIDYMVENVDKYDNAAIRQYCHDNFSEEAISQKIITVYKEVLEKHKK